MEIKSEGGRYPLNSHLHIQPQELMYLHMHTTYIYTQTCRQTYTNTHPLECVTVKMWNYSVFSDIQNTYEFAVNFSSS